MLKPFATALAVLALAGAAQAQPATARGELKDAAGETLGTVVATAAPKGVFLHVEASGLTPGWHGLHFHEKGDCSKSDFTSAGAHVHVASPAVHGLLNPAANDQGDLPNIAAGADGKAMADVFTSLVTLPALLDADGSAVVVHAAADDYMAQPIGGAGARVACAVLK
jgi:Cu-Zn family superoxide dismutase